ncbi:Amino acid kinase family [Novymonas esmeraldas]|uniref:Amino acid kinase family n=1 Tax=Novymonas esmeraldas TaxID=1808958 RepID=A0AAW0EWU2_9TRYP
MASVLASVRRIVVKVGSSILVENQEIAAHRIEALCKFVADLQAKYQVILVTSGAVAAGFTEKEMDKSSLPNKQALASMGQPLLMHMYYTEFHKYNIACAQMLLGAHDVDSSRSTCCNPGTIEALLSHNVVPIINENDASASRDLLFGDNDRFSAHVALHFKADLLVILSDIEGYYTADPRSCPEAELRLVVHEIDTDDLEAVATPNNQFATGGIVTKLQAAQFLMDNGGKMFLSSGFHLDTVRAFLLDGHHKSGTLFVPPALLAA